MDETGQVGTSPDGTIDMRDLRRQAAVERKRLSGLPPEERRALFVTAGRLSKMPVEARTARYDLMKSLQDGGMSVREIADYLVVKYGAMITGARVFQILEAGRPEPTAAPSEIELRAKVLRDRIKSWSNRPPTAKALARVAGYQEELNQLPT